MLVSIILSFALIGWILCCTVLLFRSKTRIFGLISLVISLTGAALVLWWSDPGTMTAEPPSTNEIIGTWVCYDVSPGFFRSEGLKPKNFSSRLIFEDTSKVKVERMLGTNDTATFSRSWELVRPGLTPAGAWTIEIDSGATLGPYRFVCRKKLGRMTLKKDIDVVYGYRALYRRVSNEE